MVISAARLRLAGWSVLFPAVALAVLMWLLYVPISGEGLHGLEGAAAGWAWGWPGKILSGLISACSVLLVCYQLLAMQQLVVTRLFCENKPALLIASGLLYAAYHIYMTVNQASRLDINSPPITLFALYGAHYVLLGIWLLKVSNGLFGLRKKLAWSAIVSGVSIGTHILWSAGGLAVIFFNCCFMMFFFRAARHEKDLAAAQPVDGVTA